MSRRLNNRETAIILASLRMAQENPDQLNAMPQMGGPVLSPEHVIDALVKEIDTLCEDLNCGTWELVEK